MSSTLRQLEITMKHYYGVRQLHIDNSPYQLDIFLYDTLDTIYQNKPPAIFDDGVPPLSVVDHHLFTSLRGVFLAEPGSKLHTKDNKTISLFKHVVLIDCYFFTELSKRELDALINREEVLHAHIVETGNDHAARAPREYYIAHDILTCARGVHAGDLKRALAKSKRFERDTIARFFKLDRIDRLSLRLMYAIQRFNTHNRLRMKNLRHLENKRAHELPFEDNIVHLSLRKDRHGHNEHHG